MKSVLITGWKVGFLKVSFSKLIREDTGFSLKEAKDIVDAILEDKTVVLEIDENRLAHFLSEAERMGVLLEIK